MSKKHRPPHIHPDSSSIFLTGRIYGGFSYLAPKSTKTYLLDKINLVLEKYKINLDGWVVLDNHYHFLLNITDGKLVSSFVKELHGATAHFIKKNLPSLITKYGQRLVKRVTPWDKRQTKRLLREQQKLRRELKFAKTREEEINVLAQFIARYQLQFKPEVHRELKFAITKGHLTNPAIITSLTVRNAPVWYQYCDHVTRNEGDYYRHLNYIHQNPIKHSYVNGMEKYEFSSIHQFMKEEGKEWLADCFRNYPIIDFEPTGIID